VEGVAVVAAILVALTVVVIVLRRKFK